MSHEMAAYFKNNISAQSSKICERIKKIEVQKQELYIIKIGGNVIDHPEKLEAFLKDFLKFKTENSSSRWWKISHQTSRKTRNSTGVFEGRRITNQETRDVAVMVYAGLINKILWLLYRKMV